eukprot:jgi/Ulvmu1/2268/UM013_0115.1
MGAVGVAAGRSAVQWPGQSGQSSRQWPHSVTTSHLKQRKLLRRQAAASQVCQCSRDEAERPFDKRFQASLANELGVKAIYADDHDDEEEWDDIMEEMEDPWMRDPAGLEFAGELIELPEILAEDAEVGPDAGPANPAAKHPAAAADAAPGSASTSPPGDAPSSPVHAAPPAATTAAAGSASGGYGALIPRCTLAQAQEHVELGDGVMLVLDASMAEGLPGCHVVPLEDLDADSAAPFLHRPVFVLPTAGAADATHALQACIRLRSVLRHPSVTLVEPGPP